MILNVKNKLIDKTCPVECDDSGNPVDPVWAKIISNGSVITSGETFTNTQISPDPITPDYSEVYEIV